MDFDPASFDRLASLRREDVVPLVNAEFELHDGTASTRVTLTEVADRSQPSDDPAFRAPFALVFVERNGPRRPQSTYRVFHEALGELPLFLVPIGPGDGGERYEAILH